MEKMGRNRRQIIAGETRRARQQERRAVGRLRDLTIAPKTRERYEKATIAFFAWCEIAQIDAYETNERLISTTEEFVEMCWEEGEPRATACDALSGARMRAE